jgi:two-component system, NarL family, nitrate/nitrite response regulator NarL
MSNQRAKIVVLSERAIFRECLVCFLGQRTFHEVVGVAGLQALWRISRRAAPALVFVDLADKSRDPRQTVHRIRSRWPEATVVALGTPLQLGAQGYEANGCIEFCRAGARDVAAMATAIEHPHRGRLVLAPSPAIERQRRKWRAVTDREREVLDVLACGADNLKIAAILGISERTVKAHITHLFEKLGVENRTELALLACDAGMHCPKNHTFRST